MINVDIEKLIPHRERMKLIDKIVEVNDDSALTLSIVSDKWPLFNAAEGEINPTILIELIAQTIGIAAGHKEYIKSGKGVRGWIVGVKHANFSDSSIRLGERLLSRASALYDHDKYAVFKGTVESESTGIILCDTELQLFSSE